MRRPPWHTVSPRLPGCGRLVPWLLIAVAAAGMVRVVVEADTLASALVAPVQAAN